MSVGIKFQLRLPADLKTWLEEDACRNDRSMNGQVIAVLRERMIKQLESQESRVGASKPD